MESKETSLIRNGQATAHLDDRPILDITDLRNRGLTDAEAAQVLQGNSCVSEQELYDRWLLIRGKR